MAEVRNEFLTVAEVASLLRLNQQTIRNMIDRGELPAVRVGRRVRIMHADLDRLLEHGHNASSNKESNFTVDAFWSGELHPGPVAASDPGQPPPSDSGAPDAHRAPPRAKGTARTQTNRW